jgi:hypothetical protein
MMGLGRRAPAPLGVRFWTKVEKSASCWLWIASRDGNGYGTFWNIDQRRLDRAHRVAWEMTYGPIPNGLHVLHHCDVPPCVRPDHLWLGSHRDNMLDREAKGRTNINGLIGDHQRGPIPGVRWSRKYDRCQSCARTDRPHTAHGLCATCLGRRRRVQTPPNRPPVGWSKHADRCVECGRSDAKHMGHGLCVNCYARRYKRNRRAVIKRTRQPRWSLAFEHCIDCGRTDRLHRAHGRCRTCHQRFLRHQLGH